MSDPILRDQEDILYRLLGDSYFADITVEKQRDGVIAADITKKLSVFNAKGGKVGVYVLVLMPDLAPPSGREGAPGPEYIVRPGVQIWESPTINLGSQGTGKSAEAIATRVRQLLHLFDPGARSTYTFASMEPAEAPKGQLSYVVTIARSARDERLPKVATPTITLAGALPAVTVTLACATGGASIYYTTDGTPPSSANAAATPYTAPFVRAAAGEIRAAAELSGYAASNGASETIS